jgi:hypothetical protein
MTRPLALALSLSLSATLVAQAPNPSVQAPAAAALVFPDTPAGKLMKEIQANGQVLANVEYLSDVIGARLTGSEPLRRAQAWAMATLKTYGAENVHEEGYDFGLPWTRGVDSARLLTHNGLRFRVDQMAWTASTGGLVQAEVLLVDGRNLEELQAWKGKLKGKILLRTNPDDKRPPLPRRGFDFAARMVEQDAMTAFLKDEGALAVLQMSPRKSGLGFSTAGPGRDPKRTTLPSGHVPVEPYKQLLRLLARKEPVRMELSLGGSFGPKPVQVYNVVGELKGSEKPEEVVIVGGHLDSWDLGTGTNDNATGSSVALEVLRAIKASGMKPKRTLRVILWSGEEQGLLGSRAYVEAHKAELDRIQAVLVDDMGTGAIRGFSLQGREDTRGLMAMAIAPLQELGVKDLPLRGMGGTDHASFDRAGVPAFAAIQDPADYMTITHHTQADMFDHVVPDQLIQGAQAMTVTAWGLLNVEARLPHGPARPGAMAPGAGQPPAPLAPR